MKLFPNSRLRKFRNVKSIVLSTKLVDGRAFGYTYDGQRDRTHIADCSSVDCNALTRVHRFVVQVVPTVVRQLSRFLVSTETARRAVRLR